MLLTAEQVQLLDRSGQAARADAWLKTMEGDLPPLSSFTEGAEVLVKGTELVLAKSLVLLGLGSTTGKHHVLFRATKAGMDQLCGRV